MSEAAPSRVFPEVFKANNHAGRRLTAKIFSSVWIANDHLILIANRHFQLHRVVLLHDRARGADAGIQQALEPLIAIGGKVETAVVGRNRQWHATGQAGRPAILVRCGCGRRSMQHETGRIDDFPGHRDNIRWIAGLAGLWGSASTRPGPPAGTEYCIDQRRSWNCQTAPPEGGNIPFLLVFVVVRLRDAWTRGRRH